MNVSAEGQVENQKLNQTAALLSFGSAVVWLRFWFSTRFTRKNLTTLLGFAFSPNYNLLRRRLSWTAVGYPLAKGSSHVIFFQTPRFSQSLSNFSTANVLTNDMIHPGPAQPGPARGEGLWTYGYYTTLHHMLSAKIVKYECYTTLGLEWAPKFPIFCWIFHFVGEDFSKYQC